MVLARSVRSLMAASSSCSSVLPLQFFSSSSFPPSPTLLFYQTPNSISSLKISRKPFLSNSKLLTVSFALTKTESDSPNSLPSSPHSLLQNLADCFDLPSDYFALLSNDLRLDLNDAAFDLSNGPVINECGKELGETLLNLSRAWELADTSTSCALAKKLPLLGSSLTGNSKSAFGKRLISSGRRFQSMGHYGQGELHKIAKTMIATGNLLSASSMSTAAEEQPKKETRMFKFGELQIEATPEKAIIGAAIGFVFGILSWELGQGIQSIPESSLQYANDNALLLAKSLRGALLALCYSCTVLSAFTTVGLFLYARQLASKEK